MLVRAALLLVNAGSNAGHRGGVLPYVLVPAIVVLFLILGFLYVRSRR